MSTSSSRRLVSAAMLAGAAAFLGACEPLPGEPAAGVTTAVATPSGAFGSVPLVDLNGRSWQPRVGQGYVSALGDSCARVTLTPVGAGMPLQRIACLQNGAWTIVVPLALAPGEADARFAPIPDASAPASADPVPFSQRSTL